MAPPKQEGMIFKATYSGVPVYECIINGVAVMRRRSDGWINATHILKVAGLDKPQRTRVLERDVQKGTHEKVQGGYGKYQGTWIPLEDAVKLADAYNLSHLFDPITAYVPTAESPPPAPKHVVAPSTRAKKPLPIRRQVSVDTESEAASAAVRADGTEGSMSSPPSEASSSSRTPSPILPNRTDLPEYFDENGTNGQAFGRHPSRDANSAAQYADVILNYFISETTTIPPLLVNPPQDFNPNMSIDDDEHTALHWACAMGRIRVVKLLLTSGADVFRVNMNGQTALMRAAMFSNNYDLRKFPELFELLHRSILNIDKSDRTVFHHVVDLALSRGKPHAARYYLETMLNRLQEYGSQLADILNFQDDEGETPLTMAARARSKRLTRLLLEHGADPKIRNKEGKNAEEYILEDERFRASPPRGSVQADSLNSLHTSEAGQRAGGKAVQLMTSLLHNLADSYDSELGTTERKLTQAHSLLAQIQGEIADSTKILEDLNKEGSLRDEEKKKLEEIQKALKSGAEKRAKEEQETAWNEDYRVLKKLRSESGLADGALLAKEDKDVKTDGEIMLARLARASDSPEAEIVSLKGKVNEMKAKRAALLDKFINSAREQGTGKTMAAYRRLIAAGCGGIALEEVDNVVNALCELLEEQPANANGAASLTPGASLSNGTANANASASPSAPTTTVA
ncbi:apses-domain-containing protein [Meira miltonrushii]|uniref:Apses-domain-containing protein n=1 Tax=Meira miltonrushii TaxID=1280837 RepID=A0A316V2A1_9BASI|nr:apses-domain-containing protein [Meira miltonrushii]PWN31676.1 apses-domain-containing protein [Meira miltonrushii]